MLRPVIISFFLLLIQTTGFAQTQDSEYYAGENNLTDTILYTHDIAISPDSVNAWKTDKRFTYVNNLDSLLKIKEKEFQAENKSISQDSTPSFLQKFFSSGIVKFILWSVVIGIVILILYKLFMSQGMFKRSAPDAALKELEDENQNIDDNADYDVLIRQSFRLADYRMAIRYLFLKTLRQLSDKGQLLRSADKTNFQYVQEIPADKRKEFASLVLNYEHVWYGHLNITREQYDQLEKKYISFYNKI